MNKEQRYRQQAGSRRRREEAVALWDSRRIEIESMYFSDGLTQKQIGDAYGVAQTTVANHMKRWGHDLSAIQHAGHRNGRFKDGTKSRRHLTLIERDYCRECGSTERLCVHHKNNDHFDNRLENLTVLCISCHMRHHKLEYWKAKKAGKPTPKSTKRAGWGT